MLMHRILTAIVLLALVLWGLLGLSPHLFSLLALAVFAVVLYEWSRLCEAGLQSMLISMVVYLSLGAMFLLASHLPAWPILFVGVIYWLTKTLRLGKKWDKKHRYLCLTQGVWALFVAWLAIFFLKSQPEGAKILLLGMLIVWSADSLAYFGGKQFGKNKLAPDISPGKTWEGLVAGCLGAILVALAYTVFVFPNITGWMSYLSVALVALLTSLISVVGDLTESKLKRSAGVKDSGVILPGHGGILDRIDGLIAGLPLFATYWQAVVWS